MKTEQRIHEKLGNLKKTYKSYSQRRIEKCPEMYFLKGAIAALEWVLSKKDCEDLN